MQYEERKVCQVPSSLQVLLGVPVHPAMQVPVAVWVGEVVGQFALLKVTAGQVFGVMQAVPPIVPQDPSRLQVRLGAPMVPVPQVPATKVPLREAGKVAELSVIWGH